MDYMIEYWKGKETNPIEFLSHFRCTTEPIGGGTEFDSDGELVNYNAAVAAIDVAKKELINKACDWIKGHIMMPYDGEIECDEPLSDDYLGWCEDRLKEAERIVNEFKKAMES